MSSRPNDYDLLAYSNFAYADTHPRKLAMLADLYGMEPAPIARCRVLELGCGAGGNILPMAFEFPDSEYVGVDLSESAVAAGQVDVRALALKNIALRHADIADVTAAYGEFDYIIAHGVYSWVPPHVREKMLSIFRDNLSPRGIVYVSYNAFPDGHLRNLIRDMMLFHVRGIESPAEQVVQARAIAKALTEATDKTTLRGAIMRAQLARVEGLQDHSLFHDDLNGIATPFLLHQVVEAAARRGLQYLGDADLWRRTFHPLPQSMKALDNDESPGGYLLRDQYRDFIDDSGFRKTLLCHHHIKLNRKVRAIHIARYHLLSGLEPVNTGADLLGEDTVEFKYRDMETLKINHPLIKAALLHLGRIWPAAIAFPNLIEQARAVLAARPGAPAADAPAPDRDDETNRMAGALFRAVCTGHIQMHIYPPTATNGVSERPEVSALARYQAAAGTTLTSLLHTMVQIEDDALRRFIPFVDGTRTADELAADLEAAGATPVSRQAIDTGLSIIMRLALLVR